MRIDAMNQVSQLYQKNNTRKYKETGKTSFSDTLEISQAGRDLQVARSAVSAAPDVREDRIAALKAQIENGTYSVSDDDLVEKLLSFFDI